MKTEVQFHVFLTSALVRGEWSASCPCSFTPGKRTPCTLWTGAWVGPTAGLENVKKYSWPYWESNFGPSSSPLPIAIPAALSRLSCHECILLILSIDTFSSVSFRVRILAFQKWYSDGNIFVSCVMQNDEIHDDSSIERISRIIKFYKTISVLNISIMQPGVNLWESI
jgi:hypothetical protein